jgi:hypothetical protein
MEEANVSQGQKPKSFAWIWIVLLIIVVGVGGYFEYLAWNKKTTEEPSGPTANSTKSSTTNEKWTVGSQTVKTNTTSTDTHKISDSSYRMYFNDKGGIAYAESSDCKTFGASQPTGVKEEPEKMISNPSVLEISDGNWIMIYEMAPAPQPGQKQGPSGPATQRNLYLATSSDGKSFTAAGIAIDSSKSDGYFASVPELVKTPEGKVRMYYVSGGESTGSALSSDNGKTWTREDGYRIVGAVDPDVLYKSENGQTEWVMYFSILDPAKNALYKSTSSDGLTWKDGTKLFGATTGGAIVDPDVVEISADNYVMFLGQSTGGGSTAGEEINLYRGEFTGKIF